MMHRLVTYMEQLTRAVQSGGLKAWARVQNIPGSSNSQYKGPEVGGSILGTSEEQQRCEWLEQSKMGAGERSSGNKAQRGNGFR